MSGEGGTSCEVELVSCSLSELSSCPCLHVAHEEEGSCRRKQVPSQSDIFLEDIFLTGKRAFLRNRPTLIDHLLYWNKSALTMGPKKARGGANNAGLKRKREPDATSSTAPPKKAKKNQPTSNVGNKKTGRPAGFKADPLGVRTLKKKLNSESGSNRKSSRISSNKRVPISLRSGRKLADKKKRIEERKKLKNEKDSNSNVCSNDANGIKSEEESPIKKEGSAPVKKEGNTVGKRDGVVFKKATLVKKENNNQPKSQGLTKTTANKKTGNKSDAGGSTTSENVSVANEGDVKKRKKKRKRCSMYVRKFKKNKKSGIVEEPGDSLVEDDDEYDDDDAGRASDVSLMSTTTQESSSLLGTAIEEKPGVDTSQVSESRDRETPVILKEFVIKIEKDVKVEEIYCETPSENEILPHSEPTMVGPFEAGLQPCLDAALDTRSDILVDSIRKGEPTVSGVPIVSEAIVEQREKPISLVSSNVDSVEQVCDDVIPVEVVRSVSTEVTPSVTEERSVLSGNKVNASNESAVSPLLSPASPVELTSIVEVADSVDKDSLSISLHQSSEAKTSPIDDERSSVNSDKCGDIVITNCESVVNKTQDIEESELQSSITDTSNDEFKVPGATNLESVDEDNVLPKGDGSVSCSNTMSDVETNDQTEVPEQVPLLVENKESLQDSGVPESELKRDADSTTCDNPRGLDDSFGDLSLYVSEDDLSQDKEHDEGLPDSTNITQVEAPLGNGEASFEAHLPEENVVKSEDAMESPMITTMKTEKEEIVENLTEEQKQMKESVLQALGLKSLSSSSSEVPEDKPPKRSDGYTGTLKAVIKLNRSGDKKHMVYKRSEDDLATSNKLEYRICSEISADENAGGETKKLPSEPSDVVEDDGTNEDGTGKESNLVIPEKSSSFSIHPGRLCSDVCSYCFGKFGSLDTPCHVAQLKGEERQRKILENEPHLTGESCLCDACYRYVDRKANFPEKLKVGRLKPPAQASICCVTHCSEPATRTIKRKWLIKLKKSITNKLNIDMDKLGHGVYYPFCTQHHYWVEYFTVCGICRKRLNRNNLFSLGAEADRLNLMLAEDGIPARLSVNLFLCKLCRYYADLRLKYPDPTAIPSSNQNFYKNYRRKILMSLDIAVSDSDDELLQPQDDSKKKLEESDGGKPDEDVMSLSGLATLLGEQPQQQARIQVKFGNVNIGTLSNLNIGQQGGTAASSSASTGSAPASTGSNVNGSSSHHKNEPTYPEVSLTANFEYQGPNTPDGSWERYQSTLQFDKKTKQLWTELQRPYGSQTSFLRHLVMLERVWRDGYLVLASDADEAASRYITSARNRIKAFETQGPKMQTSTPPITTAPSTPVVAAPPVPASVPVSRPSLSATVRKPQTSTQSFPFLTNTGEIEVTPIRTNKPSPVVHQLPPTAVPSKTSAIQQRLNLPIPTQRSAAAQHNVQHQQNVQHHNQPNLQHQQNLQHQHNLQQIHNQQINQARKITPLDRAKSLVRMAPLYQQIQQHVQAGGERRGGPTAVRFMGGTHSSIPPLVRLPQTQPTQFYPQPHQVYHPSQQQMQQFQQQQLQQHINQQQSFFQNQPPSQQRVALPKLPRNLTVVSMPARPSLPQAITLSHAGITIEKQIAPSSRTSSLPIERPSISVFREPATP